MIDYFGHVSALRVCLRSMTLSRPPDPTNPKRLPEALTDAVNEHGVAILGTLVDHLLQYSQKETSVEIGILKQAAELFKSGQSVLGQIVTARSGLETGLTTPTAPGVLAGYNAALATLPGILTQVQDLRANLKTFQTSFSSNWMAPVGQQRNKPVAEWAWRDVFMARRTTAFVADAQAQTTSPRQRAFALGALAGAAGNLFGSAYLNSVVGGPRRSHQLRHRLAAYSVGAWLRDNEPALSTTLTDIRVALTFGQSGTPTLPPDLKAIIRGALLKAYPTGTVGMPDLDAGYSNLMEHLNSLGAFTLPPVPQPMNNALTSEMIKTQNFPFTLGDDNVHPAGSGLGTNNPGIGANENAGAVCEEILLYLIWPPQKWMALVNKIDGGSSAGEATGVSASQLVALSQSAAAMSAIANLYSLSMGAWDALAASRTVLVLRGLLYPDPNDLSNTTFTQFQAIPSSRGEYPLLPMPSSDDGTSWPASPLERPATLPSPYSAFASPLTFLTGHPYSVSSLCRTLWEDMIEHPGSDRTYSENLDLDGDRKFLAPCWMLPSGAAITSPPVDTITLSYAEI